MVTFRVNKCLIVIIIPLTIASRYILSKKDISLLETIFFRPDKDMVSIDILYFFKAIPFMHDSR
jgi:hypothetical protein